jgi:DNA processing protein
MARVHVYRVLDHDYPYALRGLTSPPDPLCVRGELLAAPSVAVVGTRGPSPEAAAYAHDLSFRLARQGVTVWSGGAVGIDAAAHRGALDAGGISVAVIGTGLDHCYPPEHAALYEEIVLTGGALVSPFELEQHATLTTFPQRNGVLAALTQATVIVQAPLKSGARSTAGFARRLGRPLVIVPAHPWEPLGAGNLAEMKLGGRLLADETMLFDLLAVPRPQRPPAAPKVNSARPRQTGKEKSTVPCATPDAEQPSDFATACKALSPACRTVLGATSARPRHLDDICARSGMHAAEVQGALLTLSLEAVLVEGPPGWFRRASFGNY